MIKTKLLAVSVAAAGLLVGCGGGSSDAAPASSAMQTGYFVDAAVANVDYDCVADGSINKTTGPDGSFECKSMAHVRFRLGELVLGEVASVPADHYVFPQDLVGVARDSGVNDARVAAMAQLLQSLDTDGNPSNGIVIAQNTKEAMAEVRTNFNPTEVPVYLNAASVPANHIKTHEQAMEHLRETLKNLPHATHTPDNSHHTPDVPDNPHHTPDTPDVPHVPDNPHHTPDTPNVPDVPDM